MMAVMSALLKWSQNISICSRGHKPLVLSHFRSNNMIFIFFFPKLSILGSFLTASDFFNSMGFNLFDAMIDSQFPSMTMFTIHHILIKVNVLFKGAISRNSFQIEAKELSV